MARYADLLLAPAEGFGRGFFLPFGQKRELVMLFWPMLDHFWYPLVTLVTFSINLSNFKKIFFKIKKKQSQLIKKKKS